MKRIPKVLVAVLVVGVVALAGAARGAVNYPKVENTAWVLNEELTYTLKYAIFKAGTGVFKVENGPRTNGRETYKVTSSLKSGKHFFYNIDDLTTAIIDKEGLFTWKYTKRQREGDYKNDEETTFDHEKATAVRVDDGTTHPAMGFERYATDVLSAIYLVRNLPLDSSKGKKFPVHDGRRDYTMEINIKGRETVKCGLGTFKCIIVQPKMYNKDGPLKKGQMTLWLTDDARKVPVMIKMQLKVGSIVGTLESLKK